MGIDYSYRVYVHRRDAGRLLREVAAWCVPGRDEHTDVVLPDGATVRLPGTYRFEAGRTVVLADAVAGRPAATFDLAPCFEPSSAPSFAPDDPLLGYADDRTTHTFPDGTTRVAVALTYLFVFDAGSLLPGHWLFDFTPATSEQSRLFLASPSIRRAFAGLADAPLCLLDVEERYRIVVTAHGREISTRVPGPCVLWDVMAPPAEAYRDLRDPTGRSRWIVGPGDPAYAEFAADLAHHSEVPGTVR
ncbi:hypothetical protein ABZS66_31685 [Dactylosporangium sp. NPDC005572]|uniref:hypothetical protein n=1 Tax=Dactylosporangium sp. NPDC005572 TaxID=3156889 RepID=UPI0033A8D0F2